MRSKATIHILNTTDREREKEGLHTSPVHTNCLINYLGKKQSSQRRRLGIKDEDEENRCLIGRAEINPFSYYQIAGIPHPEDKQSR